MNQKRRWINNLFWGSSLVNRSAAPRLYRCHVDAHRINLNHSRANRGQTFEIATLGSELCAYVAYIYIYRGSETVSREGLAFSKSPAKALASPFNLFPAKIHLVSFCGPRNCFFITAVSRRHRSAQSIRSRFPSTPPGEPDESCSYWSNLFILHTCSPFLFWKRRVRGDVNANVRHLLLYTLPELAGFRCFIL